MGSRVASRHLDAYRGAATVRRGPPVEDATVVVVAVHGRAQSPQYPLDHVVARVRRDGVAWILPAAADGEWYPGRFFDPIEHNQPALDEALDVVATIECVLDRAGVDARRVIWLGFSQGACLVAEHVARRPRRWGGVALLTGGLLGPRGTELHVGGRLDGVPVYVSNGDDDDWVPWWSSVATATAFRAAGAAVKLEQFPGRDHEIADAEIAVVEGMLARAAGR